MVVKKIYAIGFIIIAFITCAKGQATVIEVMNMENRHSSDTLYCKYLKCYDEKDSLFSGYDTVHCYWEYVQGTDTTLERITEINRYLFGKKVTLTEYFDNWVILMQYHFENGKRTGVHIQNYKNGQILALSYFDRGNLIYPRVRWYETGELMYIDNQNNNITSNTGWFKSYYKDGVIETESQAIDSTSDGFWERVYYPNGTIKKSSVYNLGKQMYRSFYSNGQTELEGYIIGQPLFQVGQWNYWYENGVKRHDFLYDDTIPNQREGTWSWWDEQGNLIKQEFYENGELVDTKEYLSGKIKKD